MRQSMSEANVQNLPSIAHEPASFRVGKSDGPVAADFRQSEPGGAFVGSPGRGSGGEIRLGLGGNDDGMVVLVVVIVAARTAAVGGQHGAIVVLAAGFSVTVAASAADVGEAENGSLHRRLVGKSPGLAGNGRGCHASGVVGSQVAATQNAMPGIAEGHRDAASGGRAHERGIE